MDSHLNKPASGAVPDDGEDRKWQEIVRDHLSSLRFGVVEIVVHESRVVQIQKTEPVRLDQSHPEHKSKI
jgi:hypothetical protein